MNLCVLGASVVYCGAFNAIRWAHLELNQQRVPLSNPVTPFVSVAPFLRVEPLPPYTPSALRPTHSRRVLLSPRTLSHHTTRNRHADELTDYQQSSHSLSAVVLIRVCVEVRRTSELRHISPVACVRRIGPGG